MTVYRPPDRKSYRYDFALNGRRHTGSTGQVRKADAEQWEAQYRLRLRQQAGGLVPTRPADTPSIQDWSEVYYQHAATHMGHPERVANLLRVVLRFWGRKPTRTVGPIRPVAGEPYHNLHVADPIADPYWIVRFEAWMRRRPSARAGQTRNQYRSTMSRMYELAMRPEYRAQTGVTYNPFRGIERDRPVGRVTLVTVDELRAWLACASYHVRLTMAIAALAPTLRVANILALKWHTHLDTKLERIVVPQHKTAAATGKPLVVPISQQLRAILEDARRRNRGPYVVSYRGEPVLHIHAGVRGAARRAGLSYGRANGVTFHTIRHGMATLLAKLSDVDGGPALSEPQRMRVMGHTQIATTQQYTHLLAAEQRPHLERLSSAVPIADLVMHARRRAAKLPIQAGGENGGTS